MKHTAVKLVAPKESRMNHYFLRAEYVFLETLLEFYKDSETLEKEYRLIKSLTETEQGYGLHQRAGKWNRVIRKAYQRAFQGWYIGSYEGYEFKIYFYELEDL